MLSGVPKIAASAITWNNLSCLTHLFALLETPSMWSVIYKHDTMTKPQPSGVLTAAPQIPHLQTQPLAISASLKNTFSHWLNINVGHTTEVYVVVYPETPFTSWNFGMALLFPPAHKHILKVSLFYMIVVPWLQESPYPVSYQNSSTEFSGPLSNLVEKVGRG